MARELLLFLATARRSQAQPPASPPRAPGRLFQQGESRQLEFGVPMVKLLAIGMDSVWLRGLLESAQTLDCEVARVDSVCDAFEVAASTAALPDLVLVDADCCDDRSGPAFRALRARLLGVPFIVAYGPGSERVARTLSSDTVVAKRAAGEVVAARLCACALRPPRE